MSKAKLEALETAVLVGARKGFQHRYEAVRVPDEEAERKTSTDMLAKFALWLSQGEARDLLRVVAGTDAIDFADAQGTCYSPGDFLTAHTDENPGKYRHGAYVFSLTPQWQIDWGGLLLFHGQDGNVDFGITPRFNALNIFAVPQVHSVSMVNRIAPYRRYSITGWLRSNIPS
jgi:Rps23 Pro-64 3,4-dihydroxylase Tpa1-like proline 4-hydroxylase